MDFVRVCKICETADTTVYPSKRLPQMGTGFVGQVFTEPEWHCRECGSSDFTLEPASEHLDG